MLKFFIQPDDLHLTDAIEEKNLTTSYFYQEILKNRSNTLYQAEEEKAFELACQFDALLSILKDMYEENFDILYVDNKIKVVLRFPEIVIKNSNDSSIVKKELFIYLDINSVNGQLSFCNMCGNTTHFTFAQWQNGYVHSHLYKIQTCANDFGNIFLTQFCLGNNTSISIQLCNMLLPEYRFEPLLIEGFFQTVNDYVIWESLEGIPYTYLEHVEEKIPTLVTVPAVTRPHRMHTDVCKILETLDMSKLKVIYRVNGNSLRCFIPTENLKDFLLEFAEDISRDSLKEIFCKRSTTTDSLTKFEFAKDLSEFSKENIQLSLASQNYGNVFRGKKIPLVIEGPADIDISEEEIPLKEQLASHIINPAFTEELTNVINKRNENNIQKHRILKRAIQISNS